MRLVKKLFLLGLLFFLLLMFPALADQSNSAPHFENKNVIVRDLQMSLIIDDFLVNDDTGTADQEYPSIDIDGSGNFVITWRDARNSNYDIYAQRYNSVCIPLGANFKVDEDSGHNLPSHPAIAMSDFGGFVITWEDYRNSITNADIYAQRYSSTGSPLGSNFKVNDDSGSRGQYSPSVAMDSSGSFVITWYDYRNGNPDIYAQRYSSSGIPIYSNFKVNDDLGSRYQYRPDIAMDVLGNFVITWEDSRNSIWVTDIYAQRYTSLGIALDSNFLVSYYDVGSIYKWYPRIALDGCGNFVITWRDERNGYPDYPDIYAQRFSSSGVALNSNFRVNDETGTTSLWYPAIAMAGLGNFIITWTDGRNGNWGIYAQRYDSSGVKQGTNYLIPDTLFASSDQRNPAIASSGSTLYFTWQDNRRGNSDIFAKVADWTWNKVEEDQEVGLPNSFELAQNYPNPFNPTTRIQFRVGSLEFGEPIHTTLKVYNILGQLVRTLADEEKGSGNYNIIWDGKDNSGKEVASGIYFYQLRKPNYTATKKMILLR